MERVSVRELQQNIRRVMERVERGETVEVTRRRRAVARLSPIRQPRHPAPWPDLDARARAVFGKRVVSPGAGERILADRGTY
jgi:prevent-host-death family protein